MNSYDFVVIGAGVIGASVAFHLARLGAKNVLVLEQAAVGSGTTSQSSGILRTHYSVRQNVELACSAWDAFDHFSEYVGDDDASCGLVKCGYMVCATEGPIGDALRASLAVQQSLGVDARIVSREEGQELLPIAIFDDATLIGWEPQAGFADANMTAASFARCARRRGVKILEGVSVTGLKWNGRRVVGVRSTAGDFEAESVISTQSIWSVSDLAVWIGQPLPIRMERHAVLALEAKAKYSSRMPVFKDLGSPNMLYYRSYGGSRMLASEGIAGEVLAEPNIEQGEVALDSVVDIASAIAARFPCFESASLVSSWTGVYDVTPDWNPVLGSLYDIEGLTAGFGFSGHGFKLSPTVGKLLAQHALGISPDFPLEPYSIRRFEQGRLLRGRYGVGAVS